ncbi:MULTISPECIES: glycosyltransferase family 4 protein [unclassified Leifsonia]|uniref:glycosyltransferase family 4 protein n=1 Tax=unclassified Leifsonia TaxID=2663824 RepID=UPI00138F68A1|nr:MULTISPECIES: glycosyltransferase family 4 protein [unclassified Leifsonia]
MTEYAGLTRYTGGIGRHYAALLPALARSGIRIDLLVFSDSSALPDADLAGVNLAGFHVIGHRSRNLTLVHRPLLVRRQYRRTPYDRVFAPEWSGLGAMLPRGAPLLTNLATSLRLATEIAGFDSRDLPRDTRITAFVQNRLEDRQIRRSAGLIAISHAMASWTEAAFPSLPPVRVVRNCVDVHHAAAASRLAPLPTAWPKGTAPTILFLGRLERRKGVTDALSAFGDLWQRMPEARLVLAGASGDSRFEPDRQELLALVPDAARSRITWLGHVDGDELYRGIREAAVTICPSRWEGFGNVALEAKAIGTPLVCTTGSGFDDFCTDGDDCLMVPPADPTALAAAIARMMTQPALAENLARRGALGVDRFAPDPVAADLAAAADSILGAVPATR